MIGRTLMKAPSRFFLAAILLLSIIILPVGAINDRTAMLLASPVHHLILVTAFALLLIGSWIDRPSRKLACNLALALSAILLGVLLLLRLRDGVVYGASASSAYVLLAIVLIWFWQAMAGLSTMRGLLTAILVPVIFAGIVFFLWEVTVVGFQVPQIVLPPPSMIADAFVAKIGNLRQDFDQTIIRSVIPGFFLGSSAGFVFAVAIDRSPFLQRGLLPLGSLVSAMPIVGVAPIMVMWFGFDWQSKVAVVTLMTFFPMMVNTLSGLRASDHLQRDLMRSYAATYLQMFLKLRLPTALPLIFNALKLNSALAMIGAIVAEFFGTPIRGMGFRIVTEVGRLNMDIVWATIAVAAVSGMVFYGLLAVLESIVTFWHPSQRLRIPGFMKR